MPEFEAAMASACESALRQILGQSGFASTVYHLSRYGVSLRDAARKSLDFDNALSAVFGPSAATLIECRILSRFYKENPVNDSSRKESLDFPEEVSRARHAFSGRQMRKKTHRR